jgi:amidase
MNKKLYAGILALISVFALPQVSAADASGDWVGQLTGPFDSEYTAQYNHVTLKTNGDRISGSWGTYSLTGTVTNGKVTISFADAAGKPAGTLSGAMMEDSFAGTGSVIPARRPGASTTAPPPLPNAVTWKLTRAAAPPAKPGTFDYDPKFFYGTYSAAEAPAMHIFPGDTVNTRTVDTAGRDANALRHGTGGDVNTGPFYVEGALPGDTLVVKLIKLRPNVPTARQGSRFNQYAVTQAYALAAQYDPNFNGQWMVDPDKGIATLPASPGLPHLTIPVKTMLGCISVAPPGEEQYRGTDLGPYGGNLDYNDNVAGTTLYFPVFHPGALLGMGDAHGAMGDGEVVGTGLEMPIDVTFTVDVIRGSATSQVRAETRDYLISFGVSGSVPESIQLATTQLAEWIKKDYKLNDSEIALLFGDVLKYDITELVDPRFNVAAKVPKSVLAALNK